MSAGCGETPSSWAGGTTSGPGASTAPGKAGTTAAAADAETGTAASERAALLVMTGRVIRVVDGDTVYVRVNSGREEKVRVSGVDTPESTTRVGPYGKEATTYTKKRLSGRTVYLELGVGKRDKYGRLLSYVWLGPPGPAPGRRYGRRSSTRSFSWLAWPR